MTDTRSKQKSFIYYLGEDKQITLPILLNVGSQFEHTSGRYQVDMIMSECPGAYASVQCSLHKDPTTVLIDYIHANVDNGMCLIKAKRP